MPFINLGAGACEYAAKQRVENRMISRFFFMNAGQLFIICQ
jgi:hypothetical protein